MKAMTTSRIRILLTAMILGAGLIGVSAPSQAEDVYPAAILTFEERGSGVRGYGEKVSDILFAELVAQPSLMLVDRVDIANTLAEQELNLSGAVSAADATQVGTLVGAKLLIAGSVVEAGNTLHLVAKIIGTETSRVLGESVKGETRDDLSSLVEQLAAKVAATVREEADKLVAKPVLRDDRIAAINEEIGDAERPVVIVDVAERHIGQATIDPAAETELGLICKATGFEILDPETAQTKQADIVIKGEGFSEFAMRRGNLVSVKARLEIKAVDPATDEVVAVDRQTTVEVDLTEQIAGKTALQNAAAMIAERILPKLAAE